MTENSIFISVEHNQISINEMVSYAYYSLNNLITILDNSYSKLYEADGIVKSFNKIFNTLVDIIYSNKNSTETFNFQPTNFVYRYVYNVL